MKGRLRAYYRDGTIHSCMPHWNDFWFCMKTKFMDDSNVKVHIDTFLYLTLNVS